MPLPRYPVKRPAKIIDAEQGARLNPPVPESMSSSIEEALARLESAMDRLDRASAAYSERTRSHQAEVSGELAVLRQTYDVLRHEASQVQNRLDHVIARLRSATVGV
ncbi:MAG TPA: hypothetical protein VHL08_03150 [Dongiaceae bacterium]|nr:hypothetical protein [Dongiaceae bacterium]